MNSLKDKISTSNMTSMTTFSYDMKLKMSVGISKRNNLYYIEHNPEPESVSEILSSHIGKDLSFSSSELDRLPHNLVVSLFSTINERQMSSVCEPLYDIWDSRTPDVFINDCFMEVGTSVLGSKFAYDTKMFGPKSYRNACLKRQKCFFVLGVGPDTITCNFFLDDNDVYLIMRAYQLGRLIQIHAMSEGFQPSKSTDDISSEYDDIFESISDSIDELIPDSDLKITKKMWEDWQKQKKREWIYDTLIEDSTTSFLSSVNLPGQNKGFEKDKKYHDDYISKVMSGPLKKSKTSKRLPVPLAIVQTGEFDDGLAIGGDQLMTSFWSDLLKEGIGYTSGKSYDEAEFLSLTVGEERQKRDSVEHQEYMRNVHRKTLSLSKAEMMEMSSTGLFGKSHSKDETDPTFIKESSKGYSLDDDLFSDDFECFINSGEFLFDKCEFGESRMLTKTKRLLKEGGFLNDDLPGNLVKNYYRSNLGVSLSFLSAVFCEINNTYRKPTKSKTFYVNVIPGYKAALAIHNTGSNKHSFYSIIVEKSAYRSDKSFSCFRGWVDIGSYMCTVICSTRRHDVSQLLCISQSALSTYSAFMGTFSSDLSLDYTNRGVKEFLFSILVMTENANQTSEFLQLLRFSYMKTNSSKIMSIPFLETIGKFPTIIRSRLCAFSIKETLSSFMHMSEYRENEYPKYDDDIEKAQDNISGVISFISKEELFNYEEALALSYLGIYHNKDKAENRAANLQIFVKMTKEELKLTNHDYVRVGATDDISPDDIPAHGFHSKHLANCAISVINDIKSKGVTQDDLKLRIITNLDKITYEELATFKASLNMTHLDIGDWSDIKFDDRTEKVIRKGKTGKDYQITVKKKTYGKTQRALEGVLDILKRVDNKTVKPYRALPELIRLCIKLGGIVTVLFKKNQIGGVREIFILTMISRIIVRFVESIARTIAELCSNEYLTKGTDKINSTPNHYSKIRAEASKDRKVISVFDSLDCQTWCQNFVFPAFGACFSVLTKPWPDMSNVIRMVFNLATEKRHEMPDDLMEAFIKNPSVESFHDSMNILKKEFLGDGGSLNNGFLSIMVKNKSNFMQGIFHYCSTILHSGHLLTMKWVIEKNLMEDPVIAKVIHTTKESSDDGSSLLSVMLKKTATIDDCKRTRLRTLLSSEILVKSYPFMCARVSLEKSTRYVENGVEEFNSFWSFRNSVISIPIKFAWAASLVKVTQSCVERQRVDHNCLNECISNGLTVEETRVIEHALAINHYESIGLSTLNDVFWEDLCDNLIRVKHPSAWFYISSPKIIGTTMGFDTTLYNFLSENKTSRCSETVLGKKLSGSFDSHSGLLIQGSVYIGNDKRYREFRKRVVKEEELKEIFEDISLNPSFLYRPSVTVKDSINKILLKSTSSGASRAFAFEDASSMIVTSSYLCTSPCLSISTKFGETWERRKMSLPACLKYIQENMTEVETNIHVDEHVRTIIRLSEEYVYAFVQKGRIRKTPVKIKLPKTRSSCEASLLSVVSMLWFSIPNGFDRLENRKFLAEYQQQYSWVSSSYDRTLEQLSELGLEGDEHVNLHNIVSLETDKDKTLSFLHTGRKSNNLINTLISCLEHCQRRDCRLIRPDTFESSTDLIECTNVENKIFPSVVFPNVIKTQLGLNATEVLETLRETKIVKPRSAREIRMLPTRFRRLIAISQIIQADSEETTWDAILNMNGAFVLSYVTQQKKHVKRSEDGEEITWKGYGKVRADTYAGLMYFQVIDDKLLSIQMRNPNKVTSYLELVTRICRRLKLKESVQENVDIGITLIKKKGARYTTYKGAKVTMLSSDYQSRDRPKISKSLSISNGIIKVEISTELNDRVLKSDPIVYKPTNSGLGSTRHCLNGERGLEIMMTCGSCTDLSKFISESMRERLIRLKMGKQSEISRLLELDENDFDLSIDQQELEWVNENVHDTIQNQVDDFRNDSEIMRTMNNNFISNFNMDEVADDANLLAASFTRETSRVDYSELILWDNTINLINHYCVFNLYQLCSGNYRLDDFEPADEYLRRSHVIIEKLMNLGIIPKPKEIIEEIPTYEDLEEHTEGQLEITNLKI